MGGIVFHALRLALSVFDDVTTVARGVTEIVGRTCRRGDLDGGADCRPMAAGVCPPVRLRVRLSVRVSAPPSSSSSHIRRINYRHPASSVPGDDSARGALRSGARSLLERSRDSFVVYKRLSKRSVAVEMTPADVQARLNTV